MEEATPGRTSVTLLERLRHSPSDEAAWAQFVDRYGPSILGWCRRWGLQEADALDVTQNVLAKLAVAMQTFRYDRSRSFRAWLKTLAHHTWRDLVESRDRPGRGSGDTSVIESLASFKARDDLAEAIDREHEKEVLGEAMRRVEARVTAQNWVVFRLLAIEGRAGAEAAREVGMSVTAAYMARSRIQSMLREEVAAIERECDSTP